MPLTQQTFFGSSIRNFYCTLGWGNQVSTLNVNLVDDLTNGDSFAPADTGTPVYFEYDSFNFGGIVNSYRTQNSSTGKPVYEVTLTDPRELLDGVQLILDGYTGDTSLIPNLYNIYGYWENNFGFGSSDINESGMPWEKVVLAIDDMQLTNPIKFGAHRFLISLVNLPTLPSYYRVGGGTSISLMEFITRVCEDGGCDFHFRLEFIGGFNVIKLYTVSRRNQPNFGKISEFIQNNTNGAVANDFGVELRNEVCSKFLVGGKVASIYLQTPVEGESDTLQDDTIMQFWGFNENGTPIIGTLGDDVDNYSFILPSRFVNVFGVGSSYTTDVMEMRAALGGQSGWEAYLWSQNNIEGPHFKKAEKIGLISNLREDIVDVLRNDFTDEEKFRNLDLRTFSPLTGRLLKAQGDFISHHEENCQILYEFVKAHAEEYYGKKFMVRIPFVTAGLNSETNIITTSVEPAEGGFLDEDEWASAIDSNYLPTLINGLTMEDGRIETYVRFDNADQLDFSDIPPDEITWEQKTVDGDNILYAFIRCSLEPKIYFLNNSTLFSPRVILNLPGRVVPLVQDGNDFTGVLRLIFTDHATENLGKTEEEAEDIINEIFGQFGGEQLLYGLSGLAETPDLAGVALQSNILTYGPWYSLGAVGKIEAEQDDSLVPWNYGGYEVMNLVGEARVTEAITNQQSAESGSIEVPGTPELNLGDELLNSGPYITNISVQIGEQGVTTTYRMETWTLRFGRLARANIERVTRLSQAAQAQRRAIRDLFKAPPPGNGFFRARENALLRKTPRRQPNTSTSFLAGEILTTPSGTKVANVVASPTYNLLSSINEEKYSKKAFVSLDGLFRPFSTSTTISGIPHYETPTQSGLGNRSVTELNPYVGGHDISVVSKGSGLPSDGQHIKDLTGNEYRSLGLRAPIIVVGWGYDTAGKPVPNSNEEEPTNNFLQGYLQKSDQWKAGPLDIKWDRNRKVWATGGGDFRVAKLRENLVGGSHASGVLLVPTFNSTTRALTGWTEESGLIRIYDGFEYSYPTTPSGARIYINKEANSQEWFVFAAGAF